MELHDVNVYRLESAARQEALRRSMGAKRDGDGPRHRVGGALVALGRTISGEPSPTPPAHRRYA